jgi:hypothetical protein
MARTMMVIVSDIFVAATNAALGNGRLIGLGLLVGDRFSRVSSVERSGGRVPAIHEVAPRNQVTSAVDGRVLRVKVPRSADGCRRERRSECVSDATGTDSGLLGLLLAVSACLVSRTAWK